MVKVRVRVIGGPQERFRMEDLLIDFQNEPTVKDVLMRIKGEKGIKIDPNAVILINGRRIEFPEGFDFRLKHMDEIAITPIISGG